MCNARSVKVYPLLLIPTDLKLPNAVILGDLNAYTDFEWSVNVLTSTDREKEDLGPCYSMATSIIPKERIILEIEDVWEATADSVHYSFTFSNMVIVYQ